MPVKFCAFAKESISLNATEKNCDEDPEIKKDNTKELFNNRNEQSTIAFKKPAGCHMYPLLLSSFSGFVETPPPDFL